MKHNPHNLTPQQVGNGWRLLDVDEIVDHDDVAALDLPCLQDLEAWEDDSNEWEDWCFGADRHTTYRTTLTREQLRQKRGL